jgi:hypothetical protein
LKSLKALLSIEKIVEACFIGKKCVWEHAWFLNKISLSGLILFERKARKQSRIVALNVDAADSFSKFVLKH